MLLLLFSHIFLVRLQEKERVECKRITFYTKVKAWVIFIYEYFCTFLIFDPPCRDHSLQIYPFFTNLIKT